MPFPARVLLVIDEASKSMEIPAAIARGRELNIRHPDMLHDEVRDVVLVLDLP